MYKKRIKDLREENNIKQHEIAQYIGIDKGLYGQYEIEYSIIPSKHLITLSNFFNVSLDYIFEFTNLKQYENNQQIIDKQSAGKRLKEFRKNNKLTQKKLAEILNTVQPVIAKYEKGINLIATPFLYTICSKYKVSADYLLGKVDGPMYFDKIKN